MRIEYGDVTREEKKILKQEIKHLRKNSETFNSIWRDLKKSKNVHTINSIDSGNSYTQIKDAQGYLDGTNRGTNISINLSNDELNEVKVGNEVWVAHEIGHAWRNDLGKVNRGSFPLPPSGEELIADPSLASSYNVDLQVANSTLTIAEEVAASHIENIVRAQLDPSGVKIPLRQEYRNLNKVTPTFEFRNGKIRKGMNIEAYNAPTVKNGYKYYDTTINHYENLKKGN